ncbi:MAG: hypothetical protein ACE5GB_03980 [Acidimicrobiales bacterium]
MVLTLMVAVPPRSPRASAVDPADEMIGDLVVEVVRDSLLP